MRLLLKPRKNSLKLSASELVSLAESTIPGSGFLYISAPYSMGKSEFLGHYKKYFFILPTMPTADDFIEGFFTPAGARMMKFWKSL